jgi:hypothetical protein
MNPFASVISAYHIVFSDNIGSIDLVCLGQVVVLTTYRFLIRKTCVNIIWNQMVYSLQPVPRIKWYTAYSPYRLESNGIQPTTRT